MCTNWIKISKTYDIDVWIWFRKITQNWFTHLFDGKRYSVTRDTAKECEQWAALKILELKASAGESVAEEAKPTFTFKQLFDEYFEKVGKHSKSKDWILVQYKTFETKFSELAHKNIHDITPQDLTAWRNRRSTQVKENTVLKEISLFSAMFTYAQKEMFLLDANAWMQITKPIKPESRYRRIAQHEIDKMLELLEYEIGQVPTLPQHYVAWGFLFAIETAMRKGEILSMKRSEIYDGSVNGSGQLRLLVIRGSRWAIRFAWLNATRQKPISISSIRFHLR